MFGALPKSIVLDKTIPPAEKCVLLALAVHADEHSKCFPRQKVLAEGLGISRKTVNRALASLARKGLVTVEHRSVEGHGNVSALYTLNFDRFDRLSQGCVEMSQGRDTHVLGVGHPCPTPRDTHVPAEQTKEQTKEQRLPLAPSGGAAAAPKEDKATQLLDLYVEVCVSAGMRNPRKTGGVYAKGVLAAARKALRRDGSSMTDWRDYFEHCAQSLFLTGRSPPKPGQRRFIADFAWITGPKNRGQIESGRYHEEATPLRHSPPPQQAKRKQIWDCETKEEWLALKEAEQPNAPEYTRHAWERHWQAHISDPNNGRTA